MMSLIAGGMSYAADQVSNNDSRGNGNSNSTTLQDEMTATLAALLGPDDHAAPTEKPEHQ
jgi:hypothetical protein